MTKYADEVNLTTKLQAGFRKLQSTIENVSSKLVSLEKEYTFLYFVDFSKDLDKSEWSELLKRNISSG